MKRHPDARATSTWPSRWSSNGVVAIALCLVLGASSATGAAPTPSDGSVLPFPPTPTASKAGPTLQQSTQRRRVERSHLPRNAPNVLVILLDDVGFGLPDTYGGPIHTPTLSRIAGTGISYNTFHTASVSSPTRAALLTGRNQHRVGSGAIAERAVDWDGYSGVMPRTSATVARVLGDYGYQTAAFGKWHNTPPAETGAMGPFTRWPTGEGVGFDYFYGFLAGETSQWEPRLFENFNPVEPPRESRYHLSQDLADKAVGWLRRHRASAPDRPFFLYWAPGAGHGPHQIFKDWADKYRGKFDDGWDALRERTFARQKELGWIPGDAKLTPRPESLAAWASIPAPERPFQLRLMEVFAGFVEHADTQAGRVIDELERLGLRENTLVIYIFGDSGSSAEGQGGTVSELLARNDIPSTIAEQLAAMNAVGGLDALGGQKLDSRYHAGWAWAGNTPFQGAQSIASHFGGTRNPMAISWPARIKHDTMPRSQFHDVNDIVPTIYEAVGIKPPRTVDGTPQDRMDGISLAYTFAAPKAPGRKHLQYFEANGSRGIYQDGWFASAFGPVLPWNTAASASTLSTWDANKDVWELYDLKKDFSQADDLARKVPQKLASLKSLFSKEAKTNQVFPVGGALWLRIHPEDRSKTPYTHWSFDASTTRMPEFAAPGLGRESSRVVVEVETKRDTNGVIYALGGASGGVALFMDDGLLVYEYNMVIERSSARSMTPVGAGKHRLEVDTVIAKLGGPAAVSLKVDGKEVAHTTAKRTVPTAFTASETFDVGVDLGSPVSLDYFERQPFIFDGQIHSVEVDVGPAASKP